MSSKYELDPLPPVAMIPRVPVEKQTAWMRVLPSNAVRDVYKRQTRHNLTNHPGLPDVLEQKAEKPYHQQDSNDLYQQYTQGMM